MDPGEGDDEAGPLGLIAPDLDRAAVLVDDLLADGEPEAGPTGPGDVHDCKLA